MIYNTKSAEETQQLAKDLAIKYPQGTIFALYGDLGSGKTTFTQGFCLALGITNPVLSPTFVLNRIYQIPNTNNKVFHFDLYRINGGYDQIGLTDLLNSQDSGYLLIEWPEKIETLLSKPHVKIKFKTIGHNQKQIQVEDIP